MPVRTSLLQRKRAFGEACEGRQSKHLTASPFGHSFSQVRVGIEGHPLTFRPSLPSDSRLPAQTPAWAENGAIHLGPAGLLMAPMERQRVLRHEMTHAFHQRLAPPGDSTESRRHAEGLATRSEHHAGGFALADFLRPAPALLAFPPQSHSPWSKVWIGHAGLLGEIVETGVTVRIFMNYDELGIKQRPQYQGYECGKHELPPIADVVKKMKKVAQKTAEMNKKLPAAATAQRAALVAIMGDKGSSAYRSAGGQGLIILGRDEFDAGNFESTIAHESSHGIFEFHSVRGGKEASARTPDPLALRIADLYLKLGATKDVPEPKARFDKKSPPPLTVEEGASASTHPAGIVMVMDTLWAGSGGHPWHGVDEFFASAYAGFAQQPDLLREIIKHYEKRDPAIKTLGAELLTLLATVGDPKKYESLKGPEKPEAAQRSLGAVSAPVVYTKEHYAAGWLVDPSTMPSPDKIICSTKTMSDENFDKELDDLLKPGKQPEKQPEKRSQEKPEGLP